MAKKITKAQKNKAVKVAKKYPKVILAIVIILLIIIIAAVVLYFVKPDLYHKYLGIGDHTYSGWETVKENNCGVDGLKKRHCTVCGEEESEVIPATGNHKFDANNICEICGFDGNAPSVEVVSASEFSIHFLELGNKYAGDCILIDCGDTEVLIDAGSRQSSAPVIKEYVDRYCTDGILEYVIATHADQDHISGFVGNASGSARTGILYQYEVKNLITFDNVKPSKEDGALVNSFYAAADYVKSKGANVFTGSQCYDEKDGAKRQYYLDEEHTVSINILYNYYYYNVDANDENNHSVVTLLTQERDDGNKHYLFTGDLEESGEKKMVQYYKNGGSKSEYDILPEVELYKAGHHGSKTSSTLDLLEVIKPKYVVVCCCAGSPEYTTVNANTFPTQQMITNVGKYTDKIYVTSLATGLPDKNGSGNYTSQSFEGYTSMNGNIVFYFKNGKQYLWCSNNDTILKDTDWFKENRTWSGV